MKCSSLMSAIALGLCSLASAANAAESCATPQIFAPGVISRPGNWEWRLSLSPDRSLALWTTGDFFAGGDLVALTSNYRNGQWSEPVIAPFSGEYKDLDAAFSPDGKTVYFSSNRPLHAGDPVRADFDLWQVSYSATRGWGTPMHLGAGPNTSAEEFYPSIDSDGNLYFGSNRDGEQWDVWRSRRLPDGSFGPAVKLGSSVNTPDYWEFNPEISPNGKTLLFVSISRPDGYGWGDIYVSHAPQGAFKPARNLGPCVNSFADDYHPTMLWDENQLIYIRNVLEDPNWYPDFFTIPLSDY